MKNLKVEKGYKKAAALLIAAQERKISRKASIEKQIDILKNLLDENLESDIKRMINDDIETLKKVQG